jgi:GDPmannose 4,6-dehydratase
MTRKRALITGISGQDGSYLSELLLEKGYDVHGIVRREALEDRRRLVNIAPLRDRVRLHAGSIDNHLSIYRIVNEVRPDECYHLAASSFVSYAFDDETSVVANNFNSTHFLLASIKELAPQCRFYFAGSSEMFGDVEEAPQSEMSRFKPRSIYGISKLAGHHLVANYRRHHGIRASTGILYNHESPRRGFSFVTRKITSTVAAIKLGLADKIELGNIDARRDWGYAPEYVEAMWRIANADEPEDFVIATGVLHSVREFLDVAFSSVGLRYESYVSVNKAYFRPDEAIPLVGDASHARTRLGFAPAKRFEDLVVEMVRADLVRLQNAGPPGASGPQMAAPR